MHQQSHGSNAVCSLANIPLQQESILEHGNMTRHPAEASLLLVNVCVFNCAAANCHGACHVQCVSIYEMVHLSAGSPKGRAPFYGQLQLAICCVASLPLVGPCVQSKLHHIVYNACCLIGKGKAAGKHSRIWSQKNKCHLCAGLVACRSQCCPTGDISLSPAWRMTRNQRCPAFPDGCRCMLACPCARHGRITLTYRSIQVS